MSAQGDVKQTSPLDIFKWAIVTIIVAVGVYGNYYVSQLPDDSLLYRVLGLTALAVIALFIASTTVKGKEFTVLLNESWREIKKVVWPTRQETTQTTVIVVAVVLVMALLLWGLDSVLGYVISGFIG